MAPESTRDPYDMLAESLDRLPNRYPRTASGVELRILKKIFSPDEAALACLLGGVPEPYENIAERAGLPVAEARKRLFALAKKALVWPSKEGGKLLFRLGPFIVGFYEAQVATMDHELAHLFEDYMAQNGTVGIMKPQPAVHRVAPAHGAVKTEWILPYDDVRSMILGAKSFTARDCVCRVQQDLLGSRACAAPIRNCLGFSTIEDHGRPDSITREEALAILDTSEEIGLVHTVSNVVEGVSYVCNCCGCCCAVLRGVTKHGIRESVARANYAASIDPEVCTACGVCTERCQVGAIAERDGVYSVLKDRCIGCGLCVTGCAPEAASLARLPDAETVPPPANYAAWEQARLKNRGPG